MDQKKFDELKSRYQSVLTLVQQQNVRLENLHEENGKLVIRGVAPSEQIKNRIWDQIKLVNAQYNDVMADIRVDQSAPATAGHAAGTQRTYTVKSGDTLSKISREVYGDSNQYMRIFNANRDKLSDPDKIRPGQELVIPEAA